MAAFTTLAVVGASVAGAAAGIASSRAQKKAAKKQEKRLKKQEEAAKEAAALSETNTDNDVDVSLGRNDKAASVIGRQPGSTSAGGGGATNRTGSVKRRVGAVGTARNLLGKPRASRGVGF